MLKPVIEMTYDEKLNEIKAFNADRRPELVKFKYRLMTENMFRYYRGTCHLFYHDLQIAHYLPPSPLSWICGDLHLENFGSFRGDNRLVYFDLNDFDEAVLAPANLELIRLLTSIFVAFESQKIEREKAVRMAELFLKTYARTLTEGKAYYIEPKIAKGIIKDFLRAVGKNKQDIVLRKHTVAAKKCLVIDMENKKHFKIHKELRHELSQHMNTWMQCSRESPYHYKVCDVAFRVAGTGSVGLNRFQFLLQNKQDHEDYMLAEMKEARTPSLLPFITTPQPHWSSEAERIVAIQKRMQNMSPAMLGHTIFDNKPYIIQEMQPEKDGLDFKLIRKSYRNIYQTIDDMAVLTASAQLRSSGRQGAAPADELIDFGKKVQEQKELMEYAMAYTQTIRSDYRHFLDAYKELS
jgi:uncharacterized protein (DUF2252 family)